MPHVAIDTRAENHWIVDGDPCAGDWESLAVAEIGWTGDPIGCPVLVFVWSIFERPKQFAGDDVFGGRITNTVSGDVSSLARAAIDALIKSRVIVNRQQVTRIESLKSYSAKNEIPCVEIRTRGCLSTKDLAKIWGGTNGTNSID